MSDTSYSPDPEPSTSRKRKSGGASSGSASKKAKGKKSPPDPFATAKEYVKAVHASPESFELPEEDGDVRAMIATIVAYTKSLEGSVAVATQTGRNAPTLKTAADIEADADRVKNLINRGIVKLMSWKPTANDGRAKFSFDGLCADPRVFGSIFGFDGPPTWSMKKFTYEEFENYVGYVQGSVRYSDLYITSDVNVRYDSGTGEFKVSGSYGKPGTGKRKH